MVFPATLNATWFDLHTQPATLIPYTVQQSDIVTQIENHLLEPPTPLAWTGSLQFNLASINAACQRRQNETLGTTGCTLAQAFINAPIQTRTFLPDTVIDIRRVAWIPAPISGFANKILRQSDIWEKRAFDMGWTTASQVPPRLWMQNTEPPISFDVDRIPPAPGQWDVLTVSSGPNWNSGSTTTLNIPDDWSWIIKWGALFDLLSRESNAKDSPRAAYCKARYDEGLAFLNQISIALALRLNNIPRSLDSLHNGDAFNVSWQSQVAGTPNRFYTAANYLAVSPPSYSTTASSLAVSITQNAPVPIAGTDYIQVARDDFDTIIDYAQHLAMFKQGGSEFAATIPLYQKFQRKAAQYNSKLREMGFFSIDQLELATMEERQNARYQPGDGPKEN